MNKKTTLLQNAASLGWLHKAREETLRRRKKQVSILDIAGRMVFSKGYQNVDEVKMDIDGLQKGIYLVRVLGNSGVVETQKLVVE